EGAAPRRPDHRRHRPVRAERGVRGTGARLPRPLRHRRRRPAGERVGRRDRDRAPARVLGYPADDPALAAVRRAPRGAVRPDRDVYRHRHGRHGDLGEPELGREQQVSEVVTRSLVRFVSVPGLDGEAALITLDNGLDHKKPNTLGPEGLAGLDAAITEAESRKPRFIAVTGKPYIFCVGADVTVIPQARSREDALQIGREGHRIFKRLRDSQVPTFAFVNGAAMGGGLELALHCRYRTVSGGAAALALPEVSLGLIPGWGGSQLLPNLIGIAPAAQVIIQNPLTQKTLKPTQAREMGIADALFEPADFLERSLEWA